MRRIHLVVMGPTIVLSFVLYLIFGGEQIEMTAVTVCSKIVGTKQYETRHFGGILRRINTYHILANGKEIDTNSDEAMMGEKYDSNGTRKICTTVYQPKR